MNTQWQGVFPAVTTQFKADLSLDLDSTASHIENLIGSGVTGIVMLGSLGENVSLTFDESKEVMKTAIQVGQGRVQVLSGVAELNPAAGALWVRTLESLGADGAMVMPSMAFRPDDEEVVAHYKTIAAATSLPLMLYNNPLSYHADATPEVLKRIAEIPNYIAIKESCGDPRRITDVINAVGNRFAIFAGVDDLILECTMLGAVGWVAGVGLAFPKENQMLWDLMMAKKWEEAVQIYRWYSPLLHLDIGTKFVQKIKLALQEEGLGKEYVRLPRLPLTGAQRDETLRVIRHGQSNRPSLVGV